MCRVEKVTSKTVKKEEEDISKKEEGNDKVNKKESSIEDDLRLSHLFDVNRPWVLVKNGSFKGHFDNVPINFRVGPWNIACCLYLFAMVYWIVLECVKCYNNPPKVENPASEYGYFETDTWQWKYNVAAFGWCLYICYKTAKSPMGWTAWISYTLQSWTMITIRHGLSALSPFFPSSSVSVYNEYLRFPMLLQTAIVFTIWNFALLPAIAMTLKGPKNKWAFLKFCFGFDLFNLHILNLPLAIINGVYASPIRELNQIDFCVALAFSLQYILFYLFVLDRLGVHFYFIFSPRSPLALITWSAFIGCIFGGFTLFKDGILEYGITNTAQA